MAIRVMGLAASAIYHPMRQLCGYDRPMPGTQDKYQLLIEDPATRLSEGPVKFSSLGWRIYLVWLPMLLLAEGLAIAFLTRVQDDAGKATIAWGAIICIPTLYLVLPALLLGRKIQLDSIGFCIRQHGREMFVPWSCLRPQRDWCIEIFQIMLAVHGNAKDEIMITEQGQKRTHADSGKLIGASFENATELKITWPYRLDPAVFTEIAAQMSAQLEPASEE